ncbi:MAG: WG repeat-containing protein [Clostridia bacterium]|nr:WG repeat-containing protein [Clostridia bacterium]
MIMDTTKMANNIIKITTAAIIGFTVLFLIIKITVSIVSKNNKIENNYNSVALYEMDAAIQNKLKVYDNYENISFVEDRARVKLNNKWGFVDTNGDVAVSLIYDLVYDYSNGVAIVELNNKNGFVDKNGNEITAIIYDKIYQYVDGLAKVKKGQYYGFVNSQGKEIIPVKYNSVDDFSEGLAAVGQNNNYGYINQLGEVVIPLTYNYADAFSEGLAYVKIGDKNCYINKKAEVVMNLDYDYLYTFDGGVAKVRKNGLFGFINTQGKQVTPVTYDSASPFVSNVSKVEKDGKFGYINRSGETIIPIQFDQMFSVDNGYIRGILNDKYYLFTTTGECKMKEMYYIGEFSCGRSCIGVYNAKTKKVKYGYADVYLNKVIDTLYDEAETFSADGTAKVKYKNKVGYIDVNNKLVEK